MFHRRIFRTLAIALISAVTLNATAYAAGAPLTAATAKEKVVSRGPGHNVTLVRKDGTEVKGSIVAIGDDTVDIQTKKSTTTVNFADVTAVKGSGLSTGAKVGIGIGIGVVVTAGIIALVLKHKLDQPGII